MFLGNGKSRRTNVNHLRSAFHPEHGLVWSDGHHVNLSTVMVNHDDVTAFPPTTLGQFDSVEQVAWSSDTTQCFLSVQHTSSVTVWKVQHESENLKFDKADEIQQHAVSQGCLWHPSKPLLVILCRDQLVLVNPDRQSTQTVPLTTPQRITTGTWSLDGSKVIVALAMEIHIYKFNENYKLVHERTLQNFSGPIRTMVPVTSDLIAMTLDLPLVQLLNQSKEDMFEATPLADVKQNTFDVNIKPTVLCHRSRSEVKGQIRLTQLDSNIGVDKMLEREILQRTGPIDVTALFRQRVGNQTSDCPLESDRNQTQEKSVISDRSHPDLPDIAAGSVRDRATNRNRNLAERLSTGEPSEKNDLLKESEPIEMVDLRCLRLNPAAQGIKAGLRLKQKQQEPISESSQLALVHLGRDHSTIQEDAKDCILSSVHLPCILNPDLLLYQKLGHVLVVGSNTQTKTYQVFVHDGKHLKGRHLIDLNLSNKERPFGLCTVPHTRDVLLLTGEPPYTSDVAFLPSSSSLSEYQLKLRTVKLNYAAVSQTEDRCSESALADSYTTASELSTLTLPTGGLLTGIDTKAPFSSTCKVEEITTSSSA